MDLLGVKKYFSVIVARASVQESCRSQYGMATEYTGKDFPVP